MELEVTWMRALKVWWSYLWRNLIAVLASMLIGGLLGGIIGFIMGMLGFQKELIQIVVTPIGACIGLLISIIPMKMILGKSYGEFRLVLVSNSEQENA